MTRLNKIKKIKKIRLHREGTHILITSALLLLIVNAALYWGLECKMPFYIIAFASIILYLLMANFFRCPIRLFYLYGYYKRSCQLVSGRWSYSSR